MLIYLFNGSLILKQIQFYFNSLYKYKIKEESFIFMNWLWSGSKKENSNN